MTREFGNLAGFQIRPQTLEKLLKRYETSEMPRGPPFLYEDPERPGYWHYTNDQPNQND